MAFITRPLSAETFVDFEGLAADHGGVFGGCWCLSFHEEGKPGAMSFSERREAKRERVGRGAAHAALVYDGAACVGWCQFGAPAEVPRIKNRVAYEAGLVDLPAWRVTCFFVGRQHRKRGVARAALTGALTMIGDLGGGMVEAYPEDTGGRKMSPTFLHAGTLALFEAQGFARERMIGKNKWVVRRQVG